MYQRIKMTVSADAILMESQGLSVMNHIHEEFLKNFIRECGGYTEMPALKNVCERLSYNNYATLMQSIETYEGKMDSIKKKCREFLEVYTIKDHQPITHNIVFRIADSEIAEKKFQELCDKFKFIIADFNAYIEESLGVKDFVQVI